MTLALGERILSLLAERPGQKSAELAKQLDVPQKTVNSVLLGALKTQVKQDPNYRWSLRTLHSIASTSESSELNTSVLSRLCNYYLDCIGHDDLGGVRVFASSKYGDVDYVELTALPFLDSISEDPLAAGDVRKLLTRLGHDRKRLTAAIGYPVRLNRVQSRSGWEGYFVEPLFIFHSQEASTATGASQFSDPTPQVNYRALRSILDISDSSVIEEGLALADELGISGTPLEANDLSDIFTRLRMVRPDWDWQEELDPESIIREPPLRDLDQPGIYNRAVLVLTERSPYTRGLEAELALLKSIEPSRLSQTALGKWLSGETVEFQTAEETPLLEVVPLNSEQRAAVRQALKSPLTVVTGPPGTGKSQVVSSIIVNAAWQGKTVLFASKNNKAVDVVEARTNALGPRSILVRLGASEHQEKLAEYLTDFLSAKTTTSDQQEYEELLDIHTKLVTRANSLDTAADALVSARNEIDRLEQGVEDLRRVIGQNGFASLPVRDVEPLEVAAKRLRQAVEGATRSKNTLLLRLSWPLIRKSRLASLASAAGNLPKELRKLDLEIPSDVPAENSLDEWRRASQEIDERLRQVARAKDYFTALKALSTKKSLEDISHERQELTQALVANSGRLWSSWLKLQPERLSPIERKALSDYSAILKLIVSANEEGRRLGKEVFRRYYTLFPKIRTVLSSWAVPSLSAKGKIPFESGFFDILVIDEASQCDIASAIPLLFRSRQVVVIGDPKQLRHISSLPPKQDALLLEKHGLIHEYPSWSYSSCSIFDLARSVSASSENFHDLRDHHRSHADIIEFSNRYYYDGRLRIATRYDRLQPQHRGEPVVRWVDVPGNVIRPGTGSAVNEREARAVVAEIDRLLTQGYRGSLGVVTPFRAQANRIRELVQQHQTLPSKTPEHDFLAEVAHKFQGDERDLMIFSPVVAKGITDGAIRFLNGNGNLFNVSITRARSALIVVGDRSAAATSGVDYLARFAEYAGSLESKQIRPTDDFRADIGPQYPAVTNPDRVSEWEHLFYRVLYSAGLRPIPQYSVEMYLLDLALIDGERRLDIEIDGERYHRDWNGELCRRDQLRNQRLMELGWDVTRFWVYQLRDDMEGCVRKVMAWAKQS